MPQDFSRPPTLRDVAARAGVDRSLVSKVINNDPRLSIPDRTRERVMRAIEELDYQPNLVARGLRTTQTYMFAFRLPELTNPVYAPIIAGAQRRAMEHGYVIAVMGLDQLAPDANQTQRVRRVDGVLLASGTLPDDAVRGLVEIDTPTVVVNRRVDGVASSILVDDEAGSQLATEHLLDRGHRNLAVLTGPRGIDTSDRRLEGFQRAVDAVAGTRSEVVHAEGWSGSAGYEAGCELLARSAVTAVFAATSMLGIGLLRAAHEAGRLVPDHLSIVTLHDSDWLNYTVPPLTAVAMPMEALGAAAVDQLLRLVQGESSQASVVTEPGPALVVRESTAAPPV